MTPRLTRHARERCAQLGISTKRAKRVVQNRTGSYPSAPGHDNNGMIVTSATESEIAVVWDPDTNQILTVVPRIQEDYVRTETGFEVTS